MALVTAYLGRQADGESYDYMIYPTLRDVTQRSAIPQRNEWMVDSADVVVAYVTHEWGGAAKTLEYARRCGKRVMLCLLYTSPSPRDLSTSRMPSSA